MHVNRDGERAVFFLEGAATSDSSSFFSMSAGSDSIIHALCVAASPRLELRLLGFPAFTLDGTSAMGGPLVEGKILGKEKW